MLLRFGYPWLASWTPVLFYIRPKLSKYGNHCVVQDTGVRLTIVVKNMIGRRSSDWLVT